MSVWYFIFFLAFIIGGMYFLMSYLLAIMQDVYQKLQNDSALKAFVTERLALLFAFYALDTDKSGKLSRTEWEQLVVNGFGWSYENAAQLFRTVDVDDDGEIGNIPVAFHCAPKRLTRFL